MISLLGESSSLGNIDWICCINWRLYRHLGIMYQSHENKIDPVTQHNDSKNFLKLCKLLYKDWWCFAINVWRIIGWQPSQNHKFFFYFVYKHSAQFLDQRVWNSFSCCLVMQISFCLDIVMVVQNWVRAYTHMLYPYPVHGEKECKIHDGAAFVTKWTLSYLCTVDRQSCRRTFSCYNHTWIEQL